MATLRCKDAFATKINGAPRVVAAGELVDADDPVVRGREVFFEPLDTFMSRRGRQVEQATAAPGEARTVTTAKRTPSRKSAEKD